MTSSTKPEVHNVRQRRQRKTEPRPQVKFGRVIFELCKLSDKRTYSSVALAPASSLDRTSSGTATSHCGFSSRRTSCWYRTHSMVGSVMFRADFSYGHYIFSRRMNFDSVLRYRVTQSFIHQKMVETEIQQS